MTADIEIVKHYRLRRSEDGDARAGRVERTELLRSLEALLAWWPPEREDSKASDPTGVATMRSLIGGDTVSEERFGAMIGYVHRALTHYQERVASAETLPEYRGDLQRAVEHFQLALELVVDASIQMTDLPVS